MKRKCDKCIDQELSVKSSNVFRFGVAALSSLVKIEVDYICPSCGKKTRTEGILTDTGQFPSQLAGVDAAGISEVRRQQANFFRSFSPGQRFMSVQFPAVFRVGENVLFPTSEGNVQDGTGIDRHGDPDLMMEFAEEYFRLYRSIMPQDMPDSLIKVMPAVHLLVIATELAIKAYLIRADKEVVRLRHSLPSLYNALDQEHRDEIERRFDKVELNSNLAALGIDIPTVEAVLEMYDATYGGKSSVYKDSRYYAEPTTTFPPSSDMHGAKLLKSQTPYPIFLPEVVCALIDSYKFFSGAARLRRLRGDVEFGSREPGDDNHGEWGLVPSSLGLVVISVSQRARKRAKGDRLEAFKKLLSETSPGFCTDWMYGGKTLLFYSAGGESHIDGQGMLNGVECRVWFNKRLGLHARDLYLLANALEIEGDFGCLTEVGTVVNDST